MKEEINTMMSNNNNKLTCVGVNSGTSVDAIDVVVCEICDDVIGGRTTSIGHHALPIPIMKVIAFESIPWEDKMRDRIFKLMRSNQLNAKDFCEMNTLIGRHFALAIEKTCSKNSIELSTIDVIGSHGQTIYHQVESNKFVGEGDATLIRSTLQIGEPGEISAHLRLPVISNFRTNDVALGGQGAPLTSIFDFLMLRHPTKWRAIQNIGGIGNVTFVPPLNIQVEDASSLTVSFDTGPGNALIDDCVRVISEGALQMDENGDMARSIMIPEPVLFDKLCTIYNPYLEMPFPKTTGRELFGRDQVEKLLEPFEDLRTTDKTNPLFCEVVRTFTEFTAYSIMKAYEMVCSKLNISDFDVIVAGGGQKNAFLMERLSHLLNTHFKRIISIHSHEQLEDDHQALDSNAKEGMLFALLAYLHEKKRVGNIPSVTGASRAVILGSKTQAL